MISREEWEELLDNPAFVSKMSQALGLLWQQRKIESDAKFHEHWDKLSFYEKYIKPL